MAEKNICKLTPEQNKFWEDVFSDSLNDGDSESVADKKAFRETKRKFPSLRKCTNFE